MSDGYEMAATAVEDHSDLPVEVIPDESGTGYGYFSGTAGWVPIKSEELVRYRVDVAATLRTLLPLDTRLSPTSSATHIEGILWNAGTINLRGRRTELWLARRLFDPRSLPRSRLRAREAAESAGTHGSNQHAV